MNGQKMASRTSIDRREFMQVSAGSLALAAVGCGRDRAQTGRSSLTVAYWDNHWPDLFTDSSSQFLVFLPLVTRNAKGELEGSLARSWEHSPDYRTWTIHLRTDVKWQDGVPVTAHDVKFTLDLLSHPDVLIAAPGAYSVRVLDDSTYTITYHTQAIASESDRRSAGSPMDDYTVYYPRHLLEQLDPKGFKSWEFWTHPVGNGPYRYVRHVPHTMMEFKANTEYYRGKPKIDRVVLKFIALDANQLTELLSGNVEAVQWAGMIPHPRFEMYYSWDMGELGGDLIALVWNHRHRLFRDPRVRRALTLAINRRELHQLFDLPAWIPIFDAVHTGGQVRRGEFPDAVAYDPERARRLLDAAGWRDVDGDGVRERDGRPCHFVVISPQGEMTKAAVYIQAQLRRAGIRMDIQNMESSAIVERVKAGQFEAAMYIVSPELTHQRGLLALFGAGSLLGYNNPKVVALVNEARSTLDPDTMDRIHRDLMPIVQADLPVIFLYPNLETMMASRRVRGLSSPYRADLCRYMEELWLDE